MIAGVAAGVVGGLLAAITATRFRALFALAFVLILVGQTMSQFRCSVAESIDGVSMAEFKEHIELGRWVQDTLAIGDGAVGVLRRPAQTYCRRPMLVVVGPQPTAETVRRGMRSVERLLIGKTELAEFVGKGGDVSDAFSRELELRFRVSFSAESFLMYERKDADGR